MARKKESGLLKIDFKIVSIILIVAMIGAVGLEFPLKEAGGGPQPSPDDGNGGDDTPTLTTIEVYDSDGYTAEGQTSEDSFTLEYSMMVDIEVRLNWQDDYGDNDEFKITVLRDGVEEISGQGTSGHVSVIVNYAPPVEELANYTVVIEALDCPGMVGPSPVDRDNGNDWSFTVLATIPEGEGA
jgi:hypothetical protein